MINLYTIEKITVKITVIILVPGGWWSQVLEIPNGMRPS